MMKISLFTPTHRETHLLDLYNSFKDQDFHEWVIVANGELLSRFPDVVQDGDMDLLDSLGITDDRVKLYTYDHSFVGALKAFACSKCTGDILLEMDHDDLLTPDALAEVVKAFEENPEVGFVYSNCANFKDDFQPVPRYADGNGWIYRPFEYEGHILDEIVSFDTHPTAASRIWYAPNHLRAWRAETYHKIGGHNPEMRVLDDQELISRTYIATPMFHIDKCLYLYRITGANTWLEHNQEIQANVMPLHCRFIQPMATVWAARNNLLALDFGGRFHSKPGLISVDLKDAEVNCDLTQPWPFEDNSVGLIVANDILEHLSDTIHVMKEAQRVLCDGGIFLIQVPSTDGRGAYQDPTHVKFFNENSFWYYTREEQAKFIDTPAKFSAVFLTTGFPNQWHEQNKISYVYAHLINEKGTGIRLSGPRFV
jgi:predicted SAM-dependent methyltransferase